MQLLADAEGAEHDVAIGVVGAAAEDDAVEVGRAIARSALVKTAIFGRDPNWGRVLAAVGTTTAAFDPLEVDVSVNGVQVCRAGEPGRGRSGVDLTGREVHVRIDLHGGRGHRHGVDQRPHPRLRPRELGVHDVTGDAVTTATGPRGGADPPDAARGARGDAMPPRS